MMWFDKIKIQFPRFPSFGFCPILEIENSKTSKSFCLLQIFIVSIEISTEKVKTFH